jgi:hypothetical protein
VPFRTLEPTLMFVHGYGVSVVEVLVLRHRVAMIRRPVRRLIWMPPTAVVNGQQPAAAQLRGAFALTHPAS